MFGDMLSTLSKHERSGAPPDYLVEACTYRFVSRTQEIVNDPAVFEQFLRVCFLTNNTPLIRGSVGIRYGLHIDVFLDIDLLHEGMVVKWAMMDGYHAVFSFSPGIWPMLDAVINRWTAMMGLFARTSELGGAGQALLSLSDGGIEAGLNFCHTSPGGLIPDPYFVGSMGYEAERVFFSRDVAWSERQDIVFWRGSTTGLRPSDDITDLPRIQLCLLALGRADCDFRYSQAVQISAEEEKQIKFLKGDHVPWQDLDTFRYHVDIDGNTNSWPGLFLKLLSGGLVFKVVSPSGFRQWYYDDLFDGVNVVFVKSDLSDLFVKIDFFRARPDLSEEIAKRGRDLARLMTYNDVIAKSAKTISASHFAQR